MIRHTPGAKAPMPIWAEEGQGDLRLKPQATSLGLPGSKAATARAKYGEMIIKLAQAKIKR